MFDYIRRGKTMKNEEFYNSLTEEVKGKLAECKTQEEIRKVLTEADIEPLDNELLDAVAGGYGYGGGMQTPLPACESYHEGYV